MPEGDTIHKVARRLAPLLVGRQVTVRTRDADDARRGRVEPLEVRARGKHLFIDLDTGVSLRTHLGMYGSWHRYAPGEPWRKPAHRAAVVLTSERDVVVCFDAKEVDWVRRGSVRERRLEDRIGLDLIAAAHAGEDALAILPERVRALLPADTPLVDVLLDQRIAAGIGNVYKSEVLFIERILPTRVLAATSVEAIRALYRTAARLLQANVETDRRTTRPAIGAGDSAWVYRRAGLPCFRCATPIVRARAGRHLRSTYWCPSCQV